MANFILDRLKEKWGDDEEDGQDGFPDMNYLIGNSSAMDVGEVPTPMDQRIGYAAQVGGSVMELQITNPATFTLERDSMISTIHQLGIDVTLHSDMNAGYTSAQKSGQGESYGYETVEMYFTEYLQELAQFKHHVKNNTNADFQIGRINPHISTTPQPPLQERMETDVGLDPFGYVTNTYDEESRKQRNYKSQNIYKNPEFLRKLYYTLFLEEANYPFDQYGTFVAYSEKFDNEWGKAQNLAAAHLLTDEAESINEILSTIQTASQQDRGVEGAWLDLIEGRDVDGIPKFEVVFDPPEQQNESPDYETIEETGENLDLNEIVEQRGINPLRSLNSTLRNLEETLIDNLLEVNIDPRTPINERSIEMLRRRGLQDLPGKIDLEEAQQKIEDELEEALLDLWRGEDEDPDPENQYISQQAKWQALQSHLEIQQIRLYENAYRIGNSNEQRFSKYFEKNIEQLAAEVFSGHNAEEHFNPDDREDINTAEEMHEDMIERLLQSQQFQRELWKESTLFYQVIPAWMSESTFGEHEGHEGWGAPKFIWETVVVDEWEDKFEDRDDIDVNLELENPRNGIYDDDSDDTYHYMDLLENFDEFRMDVAAAVGACYAWAHFTQRKVQFDLKGRDFGLEDEDISEIKKNGWTWVQWMNEFGIGVNMETMAGSPQQKFKVWKPKDIAVAAHAINMTAREQLEEVNDELDGCPAKFTIDMEHVASLGAPPLEEMKTFVKQEKDLADSDWELDIDSDKPIAKILRQMHLMDPGVEGQRGTHHGAFGRGNELLYEWLYYFVDNGFTRNENEPATILFELAEHKDESSYMMRLSMNLIEIGVDPQELDPSNVSPGDEPEDEREALIARFFGMEQANYNREWAKIEEHAFDPLQGLLEAEQFDYTYSSQAAIQNDLNPRDWPGEEYQ